MIYHNHENIRYCHERGIRISGPKLGRSPKEPNPAVIRQAHQDALDRNCCKGKFGEGKRRYGLGLIKAKLRETSETVIIMNLARLHRGLFVLSSKSVFRVLRAKLLLQVSRFLLVAA